MANYGDKASNQRAQWWDDVVQPLSASVKLMGLGNYFTSRVNWMAAPRPIRASWQAKIKSMAKALSEEFGESYNALDMNLLDSASDKADELHELALEESALDDEALDAVEDDLDGDTFADDSSDGGSGGGGELPFFFNSPWWSVGALIVTATGVTALVAKRRQRPAAGLAGRRARQLQGGSDGWYR